MGAGLGVGKLLLFSVFSFSLALSPLLADRGITAFSSAGALPNARSLSQPLLPMPSTTSHWASLPVAFWFAARGFCLAQVNHFSCGVFLGSIHSRLLPPAHGCSGGLFAPRQSVGNELCGNRTLPPILCRDVLGQVPPQWCWQPQGAKLGRVRGARGTGCLSSEGGSTACQPVGPALGQAAGAWEGRRERKWFPRLGRRVSQGSSPRCLLRHCGVHSGSKDRWPIPDQNPRSSALSTLSLLPCLYPFLGRELSWLQTSTWV